MEKCISAEFMSKQYQINVEGALAKKVDRIEENTNEYLEEYLCDMDISKEVDVEYVGGDYIIDIDFDVDLPYGDVMDEVTKCINNFIRENEYK